MHPADEEAVRVVERLHAEFKVPHQPLTELYVPEGVLVGFEVEVPWRYYFPNLWHKYLLSGQRVFGQIPPHEQKALTAECTVLETELLPRLHATELCGVVRGKDPYWEFVLPPAHNLSLVLDMWTTLSVTGLLPGGPHSLHATVSGLPTRTSAYLLIFILELLFVRKDRISQKAGRGTWSRKGWGGVSVKSPHTLLYSQTDAYELRTLELPVELGARRRLLEVLASLTHHLVQRDVRKLVRERVSGLFESQGLPFGVWGSPLTVPGLWATYLNCFDEMRSTMIGIMHRDLGIEIQGI